MMLQSVTKSGDECISPESKAMQCTVLHDQCLWSSHQHRLLGPTARQVRVMCQSCTEREQKVRRLSWVFGRWQASSMMRKDDERHSSCYCCCCC